MHHLEALALIFFQSTAINFVVQMNNFTSWRILHLKTRLPFAGRPAAPSLAFGRRRTMATSCPADRILVTTALFTGADDEPSPGAVAIGDDRVLWAGPLEAMPEALRDDATEITDYGDALIMPGFHDAHLHYFHSALYLSPLAERFVGENEADAVARGDRPARGCSPRAGATTCGTRPACRAARHLTLPTPTDPWPCTPATPTPCG